MRRAGKTRGAGPAGLRRRGGPVVRTRLPLVRPLRAGRRRRRQGLPRRGALGRRPQLLRDPRLGAGGVHRPLQAPLPRRAPLPGHRVHGVRRGPPLQALDPAGGHRLRPARRGLHLPAVDALSRRARAATRAPHPPPTRGRARQGTRRPAPLPAGACARPCERARARARARAEPRPFRPASTATQRAHVAPAMPSRAYELRPWMAVLAPKGIRSILARASPNSGGRAEPHILI
mmetsp:Transcript_63218/g.199706  ORF Transcript_63218/g.199706 Transcript_63218/m.199706 type:complete len:233 (-) Transcript_63218:18-716(-)